MQIELNRALDRIAYITQQQGVLYVQTAHAFVHALSAETGKKIWSAQIGQASQISLAPGVNQTYLAIINGSTLYVLDRTTGREKFRKVLGAAPGTGPALTEKIVFVSMVSGMIEGYDLQDHRAIPWHHRAAGRILTQPVISEGNLAWTTDKGYFYVAQADPPLVRFRVEAHAEISARPAQLGAVSLRLLAEWFPLRRERGDRKDRLEVPGGGIAQQAAGRSQRARLCRFRRR